MSYKDKLYPWCIIRHLLNAQRIVVGRLRRRNDAEEHLRLLKRMTPTADYGLIFDLTLDSAEVTAKNRLITL